MSLWDAAALDAAGQDGEVPPTFINLADASIKMVRLLPPPTFCRITKAYISQIETLPTHSADAEPLNNVLSVSTAGKNRYLFHFSNINALTQWTAGIRLAMYEHATLQEAYTGSLIAGKGKMLNNIKTIMERTKFKTEDWTRVRFGAGTPWRRCWCVITPPDEKEVQKQQKSLKKKSAYDKTYPVLKGDIRFYDTKRTKKVEPIATITEAYSAYAIYPQSKPLIDQSTLIKIEGLITIHSQPQTTTEGFVFVMPEVHPAVTGFEMMLRYLFPVYDIFHLYGRPTRLVADTLDPRSLMFAMPQERRYGYLEILDVATLIHTEGSQTWTEKEWRKQLKLLTSQRITKMQTDGSRAGSRMSSRRGHRNSLPTRTGALRFDDGASVRSTPSLHRGVEQHQSLQSNGEISNGEGPSKPMNNMLTHQRSTSESAPFSTPRRQRTLPPDQGANYTPSRLSYEATPEPQPHELPPPPPPTHGVPLIGALRNPQVQRHAGDFEGVHERSSSESERNYRGPMELEGAQHVEQGLVPNAPPAPVAAPPAFAHQPGAKPQTRPYHSPELRRANSRMSSTTLSQLAAAGGSNNNVPTMAGVAAAGAAAAWRTSPQPRDGRYPDEQSQRGVIHDNNTSQSETPADHASFNEGMVLAGAGGPHPNYQHQPRPDHVTKPLPNMAPSYNSDVSPPRSRGYLAASAETQRSISPLSQSPSPFSSSTQQASPSRNFSRHDSQPQDPLTNVSNKMASNTTAAAAAGPSEQQRPDELRRHSTTHSITRKPVPSPSQAAVSPAPRPQPSTESIPRQVIDQDTYERIKDIASHPSSEGGIRRNSGDSSNYDTDSVASPDYASTIRSTETRKTLPQKPRTGILKTVGTVDPSEREVVIGDTRYRPEVSKQSSTSDIPSIDFGPTKAYSPGPNLHGRTKSSDRLTPSPQNEMRNDAQRYDRPSPGQSSGSHSRTSSRNLVTPEPGHHRSGSAQSDYEKPRNMAWQPGMAVIGTNTGSPKQSITPEQFVHQRVTSNRIIPTYAHGRKQSGTPPQLSRHSSGDWSPGQQMPSQSHSRAASATLNMQSSNPDISAHLSAREQEHVARVTGSPLLGIGNNNPRPTTPSGGLIGAIEAREREKREMREGVSGQIVQQAIAQRQQQNQANQQAAFLQQQFQNQPPVLTAQEQSMEQQRRQQLYMQQLSRQQTNHQQQLQQQLNPQPLQQQFHQQLFQQQQAYPLPSPQLPIPGTYPQTPQTPFSLTNQFASPPHMPSPQQQQQQQQQQPGGYWPTTGAQVYWNTAPTPRSPYQGQAQMPGQPLPQGYAGANRAGSALSMYPPQGPPQGPQPGQAQRRQGSGYFGNAPGGR